MSENNLDSENEETLETSMEETLKEIRGKKAEIEEPEEVEDDGIGEIDEADQDADEESEDDPEDDTEEDGEAAQVAESDTPSDESPEPVEENLVNPPTTWRAGAKAKWKDIDPEIRAEIKKREEESLRGVNQVSEKARSFDELNSVIQPYEPLMRSKGVDSKKVVQSMLNTYYQLETASPDQKKNLFVQLAQNYGVDLGIEQDATQRALQPLQSELQQLKAERERERQLSQQREQETVQTHIQTFASEADESGSLKHPYFENVKLEMSALIQSAANAGRNMTLQEAYDAAVWSNPETRSLMQSQQLSTTEQERQEKAKEKAIQAKKASKPNLDKKGTHSRKQQKPTGSVDDTMKETLAELKANQN